MTLRIIYGTTPCATCDHPFGEHDYRSGPVESSECHRCDCTRLLPPEPEDSITTIYGAQQ